MNSSTRRAWLPGILAVALLIRLLLFSGIQGNDDAIYYSGALRISPGSRSPRTISSRPVWDTWLLWPSCSVSWAPDSWG